MHFPRQTVKAAALHFLKQQKILLLLRQIKAVFLLMQALEHVVQRKLQSFFPWCGCPDILGILTYSCESVLYNTTTYNLPPTHKPTLQH